MGAGRPHPWTLSDPARLAESYFRGAPFIEEQAPLSDDVEPTLGPPQYWFPQTPPDILIACLKAGLAIEAFVEFPRNITTTAHDIYQDQPLQPPLCYWLTARKPAAKP
ncbi:MAG: hypothetical protein RIB45_08890 [Marivibrio sp.]|uniref:hypothetical protein n=1 Tax=Marivibrio sp. TaxID=2039719 RepID=UPI0032ED4034